MELVEHVITANGGRQVAAIAAAAGISPQEMERLLRLQVPAIATRIRERAAADEAELEAVFDLLEDGEAEEYLQKEREITTRDAVADGEDILEHLYGSLEAARAAAPVPEDMSPELAARLMTFSAVLTVAAMTRRYRTEVLPAMSAAASGEGAGGGLLALLLSALIDGLIKGLSRALLPRRRRRRTRYSYRYRRKRRRTGRRRSRRRTSRRRRRRSSSILEDVLGNVLKNI